MLTREQILEADDLPREECDVQEWGGAVMVRTMTGTERDKLESEFQSAKGVPQNLRARLVALTVVDENGDRLFTDKDIAALGNKSAAALDRVFAVAMRLNGMSADDVEALEKN